MLPHDSLLYSLCGFMYFGGYVPRTYSQFMKFQASVSFSASLSIGVSGILSFKVLILSCLNHSYIFKSINPEYECSVLLHRYLKYSGGSATGEYGSLRFVISLIEPIDS